MIKFIKLFVCLSNEMSLGTLFTDIVSVYMGFIDVLICYFDKKKLLFLKNKLEYPSIDTIMGGRGAC